MVVVGNLTVGGTGKTPLVAWLAEQLSACGCASASCRAAMAAPTTAPRVVEHEQRLARGRRRAAAAARSAPAAHGGRRRIASPARAAAGRAGCRRDPRRRRAAAPAPRARLRDRGRRRARGFGNGALLPAGPLREPVSRLRRVDAVVVNGAPDACVAAAIRDALDMRHADDADRRVSGWTVRGDAARRSRFPRPARACGGGHRQSRALLRKLRARGLDVVEHPFPDHHPFTASDLDFGDDAARAHDGERCRKMPRVRGRAAVVRAGHRAVQRSARGASCSSGCIAQARLSPCSARG